MIAQCRGDRVHSQFPNSGASRHETSDPLCFCGIEICSLVFVGIEGMLQVRVEFCSHLCALLFRKHAVNGCASGFIQ
jgi:hypothetical protein